MLKLEPGGSTIPKIPFIRPSFPGPAELAEDFVQIAQANWYTNFGPNERRFARALRDYLGPHLHVATLANGTLALLAALHVSFGAGTRDRYLPRDELDRLGVRLRLDDTGALDDPDGRLAALLRFSADRAADWYSLGLRLIPHLDRRSAACCAAMSGIYRRQLALIRASPAVVYDRRISLSGLKKAQVAAAALASSVTCGPAHGPLPADLGSHPSH